MDNKWISHLTSDQEIKIKNGEKKNTKEVPGEATSEDHTRLSTTIYIFQVQEAARTSYWLVKYWKQNELSINDKYNDRARKKKITISRVI